MIPLTPRHRPPGWKEEREATRFSTSGEPHRYVPKAFACASTRLGFFPHQFTGDGLQKVTAESPSRAITARRPRQTVMGAVPREPRQLGEMEEKSRLAPILGNQMIGRQTRKWAR